MMFAVNLSFITFVMLRYVPSMPTFWRDFFKNHKWVLNFRVAIKSYLRGGLKHIRFILSQFWRPEIESWGVSRVMCPLRSAGKNAPVSS